RASVTRTPQGLLAVVDHEPDVPAPVRRLRPRGLEGDELVAQVHEGHAAPATAELDLVEDAPEKRERLRDVTHLDGDVIDPDQARHALRLAVRQVLPRRRAGTDRARRRRAPPPAGSRTARPPSPAR